MVTPGTAHAECERGSRSMELVRRNAMNRSGLRMKTVPMAVFLLALGVNSLQSVPAHAYLSEDQQREGEVTLDFDDPGGELPKHPPGPGGGTGSDDGTRRADPDDFSFNAPRVEAPVVPATPAARPAWFGLLRVWLQQMFAQLAIGI